jgi:hypothetical protein
LQRRLNPVHAILGVIAANILVIYSYITTNQRIFGVLKDFGLQGSWNFLVLSLQQPINNSIVTTRILNGDVLVFLTGIIATAFVSCLFIYLVSKSFEKQQAT